MRPQARTPTKIDATLAAAGWIVRRRDKLSLHVGLNVAVREMPKPTSPADYLLALDRPASAMVAVNSESVTSRGIGPQGAATPPTPEDNLKL